MSNRLLTFSAERLLLILKSQPRAETYRVGFSGGADSTALLHALKQLESQLETPIQAIHVNHGIHDHADRWQEHCERFCRQQGIALVSLSINIDRNTGLGLEAEARHLRYQAMSALLKPGDSLLTAHHADDQAETLLLNLMRGSGVDGLSAMPHCRPLGAGVLQRPLLNFENSELINYLQENNTTWIEDPSNQVLNHDRNFVRHQIMPLLESRWQGVNKRMLLTCNSLAETRTLLEHVADEYLDQYQCHRFVLQVAEHLREEPALFKLAIRRWLKQTDAPPIPARSLEALYDQVFHAGEGHRICIQWGGWLLRLHQNQLWLQQDVEILPCPGVAWPAGQAAIDLGGEYGQLTLAGANVQGPPEAIVVSNRQIRKNNVIRQGAHHKNLKNLFQAAGIPGWFRDSIPLCELKGKLVAIGDWCFDDQFAAWMSANHVNLTWQPQNALLQFIVAQQHPAK